MNFLRNLSLLLFFVTFLSSTSYSFSPLPSSLYTNDPILEISDKHNEVRLGISDSKIYMIISDNVLEYANQQILQQHRKDLDSFADSNGNFLITEPSYLETNRIEFDLDDVESIEFSKGALNFQYRNKFVVGFEEILSFNGVNALDNFYLEDLELFAITFKNYSS